MTDRRAFCSHSWDGRHQASIGFPMLCRWCWGDLPQSNCQSVWAEMPVPAHPSIFADQQVTPLCPSCGCITAFDGPAEGLPVRVVTCDCGWSGWTWVGLPQPDPRGSWEAGWRPPHRLERSPDAHLGAVEADGYGHGV